MCVIPLEDRIKNLAEARVDIVDKDDGNPPTHHYQLVTITYEYPNWNKPNGLFSVECGNGYVEAETLDEALSKLGH